MELPQAEGVCGQLSHLNRQMVMNFLSLSLIYVPDQSIEAVNRLDPLTLKFSLRLMVKTFIGEHVAVFVQSQLTIRHSWPFLSFGGTCLRPSWVFKATNVLAIFSMAVTDICPYVFFCVCKRLFWVFFYLPHIAKVHLWPSKPLLLMSFLAIKTLPSAALE